MAEMYNAGGSDATGTAHSGLTSANYNITSPYVMQTLGKAQAVSNTPYRAFTTGAGGEAGASSARVASMNPMETNAYQGIAGLNAAGQMQTGMGNVNAATNAQWGPNAASSAMSTYNQAVGQNPLLNQATQGIASMNFQNPMQQGMELTQQATGQFGLPAAQQYMSPYMQQVTEQNKQNAIQDWQRQQPQQQAAGFQAGAGRGSRSALLQAEGQRNLQNQLGDIQAKGSQAAYENAQAQYNADMNRRLTGAGQLFNQGSDIYGRQSTAGENALNRQIDAYNRGMGQFNTQADRQMTGGQNQFNMGTDIFGKQVAGGQAQQQNKQQILNAMYEDFQKEQAHPKEQVNYMMDILKGVPQYSDYSTKSYQTAAPVDPNAAKYAAIKAGLGGLEDAGGLSGVWDKIKGLF